MNKADGSTSRIQSGKAAHGPSPAQAGEGSCAAVEETNKGGRTTNSPPANGTQGDEVRALLSGFDALKLGLDITWESDRFFRELDVSKREAMERNTDTPFSVPVSSVDSWDFLMKPFGAPGWRWIFKNKDFHFVLGACLSPISRPSAMVEIKSEALWRLGAENVVAGIEALFRMAGALEVIIKPSRVDLCTDLLIPEKLWDIRLLDFVVCRADSTPHCKWPILTGFSFGKGDFCARIYDKPREIREKSQKTFFYDLWGLPAVPEGFLIARVECQVLREAMRELDVDLFDDLLRLQGHLWRYFTERWLKFQSNPGKHQKQRRTLPFWRVVQDGYRGAQGACPLVRAKAIRQDLIQTRAQLVGQLSRFTAIIEDPGQQNEVCNLSQYPPPVRELLEAGGITDEELARRVADKMAKHRRIQMKYLEAEAEREERGLKEWSA